MFGKILNQNKGKKTKRAVSSPRRTRKGRRSKIFASVAEESEWDTEMPGIRISRAFAIVLAVHAIAVGALIIHALANRSSTPISLVDTAGEETTPAVGGYAMGIKAPHTTAAPSNHVERDLSLTTNYDAAPSFAEPTKALSQEALPPSAVPYEEPKLRTYRIVSGDSLFAIARKMNVNLDDLIRANGLDTGEEIYPGQNLLVPASSTPSEKAELKKAETLLTQKIIKDEPAATAYNSYESPRKSAANSHGMALTTDAYIRSDSSRSDSSLTSLSSAPTDQRDLASLAQFKKVAPATTSALAVKIHKVSEGETIYGISKRYKIDMDRLLRINGVSDASLIRTGTMLRVPNR